MNLDVPQYLAELTRAKDMHLLDWHSTSPNGYEYSVGRIKLVVSLDPRHMRWDWRLQHERSGVLTSGSSEDRDVAQQEAIAYAMHWVKHAMVGVLA